jgi:Zn finger protein HypA/HybF involved in hydrogenase expression
MSIAQEICRIAREQVGEEGCPRVVSVGIEIGPFSGVEPDNLVFWLEILLGEPPFNGAVPLIHPVDGDVLRVSYLEVEDGLGEE